MYNWIIIKKNFKVRCVYLNYPQSSQSSVGKNAHFSDSFCFGLTLRRRKHSLVRAELSVAGTYIALPCSFNKATDAEREMGSDWLLLVSDKQLGSDSRR